MAVAANATYYVAGNGTAGNPWCDGKNWAPDGSAMDANNEKVFKDVPAGTYQFKVTNGTWDKNWGYDAVDAATSTAGYENGNGNVKITTGATADITIKFNESTEKITVIFSKGELVVNSWTIAGVADLMGSEWDPADTKNDMTKQQDGTWKLVKYGVTLAVGEYEYKAAANHAWSILEVPSEGNNTLDVLTAGVYNVTFVLSADYKELTAETVDATGVNNVYENARIEKVIENGQMVIMVDGVRYNAAGTRF